MRAPRGFKRPAVVVSHKLLCAQPVRQIATLGPTLIDPEQVRGMLDFSFGRVVRRNVFFVHMAARYLWPLTLPK